MATSPKRRATEIIAEAGEHREPVMITQYGRPGAHLFDDGTYEAIKRRLAILEGIARGERAVEQGRILSHAQARKRMARWLS